MMMSRRTFVKELKSRTLTRQTILLLLYVFAVNITTVVAMSVPLDISAPLGSQLCFESVSWSAADSNIGNLYSYGLYILIPLAGWIGDAKIGRRSAITISLVTGWLGTMLLAMSSGIQSLLCGGEAMQVLFIIAKYVLSTTSLVLLVVSVSFCYANIFSFGVTQLLVVGASSSKIRAFVHWAVWAIFASGNITFMVTQFEMANPYIPIITVSLISFVMFSLSICFHFNCHHWFEDIQIDNNYKLLWGVLKYAWKHHYPEKRSSLTYWEDKVPSRIDFAKIKFGGPFPNENVETVKTFLRILVIVVVLIPYLFASDPLVNEIMEFIPQYKGGTSELHGFAGNAVWFIGDNIILLVVPLLEFVILPLFPKFEYFLINPLRGIGLSMVFIIAAIFSLCVIDIIAHIGNPHVVCYSTWTKYDPSIDISLWIMLIPSVLSGMADMLNYVYVFVFLCSQAPSGMSGMLIGIFWFIRGISIQLSALILIGFEKLWWFRKFSTHYFSCTSLLMITLGATVGLGMVLYVLAARWYTNRVRNEDLNLREAIETHFEHGLLSEENHRKYLSITDEDSINK